MSAIESEEPFSGETIKIEVIKNAKKIEKLMEASRKNNAIVYKKPEGAKKITVSVNKTSEAVQAKNTGGVPDMPEFQST
jgi:hypothetical protein